MQPSAKDLLQFWFGTRPYTAVQVQQHARLWFGEPGAPEERAPPDDAVPVRLNLGLGVRGGGLQR